MAASEEPEDINVTFEVRGLRIELSEVRAGLVRFESTAHVVVELFHPLLRDLPPDLADELANGVIATLLGQERSEAVIVTRTDHEPFGSVNLAELRGLLESTAE